MKDELFVCVIIGPSSCLSTLQIPIPSYLNCPHSFG